MNVDEFAKLKHGEQKRKYTGEPYWYHLEEVAHLVWKFGAWLIGASMG